MKAKSKTLKKILSATLALCTLFGATGLAGCGSSSSNIQFWVYGDESELKLFSELTDTFNNTYGKEHDISVEVSSKPVGTYTTLIQQTGSSRSGADVFFVAEADFKRYVEMGFMTPIEEYMSKVDDIDVSDIPDSMLLKYRYDEVAETKSKSTDPLYGLPMEVRPTALYYNESMFESAGIVVISVDEENMDKWNNNEIPDNRGKYKRDFAKLKDVTVPKKGFYRSDDPCVNYGSWSPIGNGEIAVFNNRIAMNWDEVEDLARNFATETNPQASVKYGSDYGYYTEWWFNYGWSVGGDCLADLNNNGYWNYSLLDPEPNYKVNADTYVGEYTGKTYTKGETLDLIDKYDVPKGEILTANDDGTYSYNGKVVTIRESVKNNTGAEQDNLTFVELPSTRDAFERYLRLGVGRSTDIDGIKGLSVSPKPSYFTSRSSVNYFCGGKIAMLVEQSSYVKTISDTAKFKWDVAPIAVYKEYVDESDPQCDTVKAQGIIAGHSNSRGLMTRTKSLEEKGDQIVRFIMWMASRNGGQKVLAKQGFFPNQESLINEVKFGDYVPTNIRHFAEAMKYQKAGDWWYLKNFTWIDVWAVPLNSNVRNDLMGYREWILSTVSDSNEDLYDNYIKAENKKK